MFAKLSARGPAHRTAERGNLKSRSLRRLERKNVGASGNVGKRKYPVFAIFRPKSGKGNQRNRRKAR
ncbi:MAG: hypothetical protein A2782_02605 [Candidatus Blackburnbacteria bacterium RIFCSPHIGHO2_01_FULL_43_15b]|uniref:Uncharacterized protein n=1 Tax=Candidatus Blackburnbacteria bacterium RIFCSPHIGHO2_01_FULL_43_15b TaxID=1797513 RepID=A0A1G1V1S6_9BACT|nr:MAG: hypothetical protein A2782_02605 [Candidatus Blackburnbacteria bacterium RIFCSPHIGHO2_01_FULL_43_15b]